MVKQQMEKVKALWLTLVANPFALRVVRYVALLLLGAAIEQVARLGVLPPELVDQLREAIQFAS